MGALYLFRHAKSDWSDRSLRDHDRPLAARGSRAAPAMAGYMAREGLAPRIVLCSTAERTRQTWALMEEALGSRAAVIYDEELYGAPPGGILEAVGRVTDGAGPVMVVGHNPGLGEVASFLAGEGDPDELDRMGRKFPTAALAVLRTDVDRWQELGRGTCRLERFVRPKDLEGADERGL